jgi:hypothetical protein
MNVEACRRHFAVLHDPRVAALTATATWAQDRPAAQSHIADLVRHQEADIRHRQIGARHGAARQLHHQRRRQQPRQLCPRRPLPLQPRRCHHPTSPDPIPSSPPPSLPAFPARQDYTTLGAIRTMRDIGRSASTSKTAAWALRGRLMSILLMIVNSQFATPAHG